MTREELEGKVNKLAHTIWDITIFNYALLFITSFLASVLVFIVLKIWPYFAFAPATGAVILVYARKERHKRVMDIIERGNPALKERLKTAYDNRDKDNLIVRELTREVNYDLENVDSGVFVSLKRTNTYVGVSVVIVFLLLFLLFSGFEGIGLSGLFGGGGGGGGGGSSSSSSSSGGSGADQGEEDTSSQDISTGTAQTKDIYGDSSMAKIEGTDVELEIHPEYGEQGTIDAGQGENQDGAEEIRSGFVQATAADPYSDDIPVELENVVRKYFEKLSED